MCGVGDETGAAVPFVGGWIVRALGAGCELYATFVRGGSPVQGRFSGGFSCDFNGVVPVCQTRGLLAGMPLARACLARRRRRTSRPTASKSPRASHMRA